MPKRNKRFREMKNGGSVAERLANIEAPNRATVEYARSLFELGQNIAIGDTKENIKALKMGYVYSWIDVLIELQKEQTEKVLFRVPDVENSYYREFEFKKYCQKLLDERPEILFFLTAEARNLLLVAATTIKTKKLEGSLVGLNVDPAKYCDYMAKSCDELVARGVQTKEQLEEYYK